MTVAVSANRSPTWWHVHAAWLMMLTASAGAVFLCLLAEALLLPSKQPAIGLYSTAKLGEIVALAAGCAVCLIVCVRASAAVPGAATVREDSIARALPYIVLMMAALLHLAASFTRAGVVGIDISYQLKAVDQFLAGDRHAFNAVTLPDASDLSRSTSNWQTFRPPGMFAAVLTLRAVGIPWPFVLPLMNAICFLTAGVGILSVARQTGLSVATRGVLAVVLAATPFYPFHALETPEVFTIAIIPWLIAWTIDVSRATAQVNSTESLARWAAIGLLLGGLYWVKYSALVIGVAFAVFIVCYIAWTAYRGRHPARGVVAIAVFALCMAIPVETLRAVNANVSGTTAEQVVQQAAYDTSPVYFATVGHYFGSSARGSFPIFCLTGSFARETELGRWLLPMATNLILGRTAAGVNLESSWRIPGRLTIDTLLAIPLAALLVFCLINACAGLEWPIAALLLTVGFVSNMLHVPLAWVTGFNSLAYAYNYLAPLRFLFYIGVLLLLEREWRERGGLSWRGLPISRRVALAVVIALALPFGTGVVITAKTVAAPDASYRDNMVEINNAPYGTSSPLQGKRILRNVLTSGQDAVFLYGVPPASVLDFSQRAWLDPDPPESFAPAVYVTSTPLRILLVVDRRVASIDGRVVALQRQFRQANGWHAVTLPADADVVAWFADLQPGHSL